MPVTTSVQKTVYAFETDGRLPRLRRPHLLQGLEGFGAAVAPEEESAYPYQSAGPEKRSAILYAETPPEDEATTIPAPDPEQELEPDFDTSGEAPDAPPADGGVVTVSKQEERAWVPWAAGGAVLLGIGWIIMRRRKGR